MNAEAQLLPLRRRAPLLRADDAPPRQPLYINGNARWRVDTRHGALELSAEGRALRRFPLGRIDRVICGTGVDWTGEALFECLKSGITVLFENGRAQAVGYALPAVAPGEPLHQCLMAFSGLAEAHIQFENWLRHRRMEVVARWWEGYLVAHPSTTGYYYDEVKRQFVYWAEVQPRLNESLRVLCEARALAELRRAGALPAYDMPDDGQLAVLEEITTLVWGQINLESGALAVMAGERLLQVNFLEAWFEQNALALSRHLSALKLFVVEALRPWR